MHTGYSVPDDLRGVFFGFGVYRGWTLAGMIRCGWAFGYTILVYPGCGKEEDRRQGLI